MRLTPNLRRRSFQMVVIPGPMPYPVLSRFHFVVVPCCVFILVQLCPGCSIIPLGFFSNPFVSGGVVDLGDYLFSRLLGVLFGSFSFIVSISVVQLGFMSAAFNFCLPG